MATSPLRRPLSLRPLLPLALLALAAPFVACGGDEETATPPVQTKAGASGAAGKAGGNAGTAGKAGSPSTGGNAGTAGAGAAGASAGSAGTDGGSAGAQTGGAAGAIAGNGGAGNGGAGDGGAAAGTSGSAGASAGTGGTAAGASGAAGVGGSAGSTGTAGSAGGGGTTGGASGSAGSSGSAGGSGSAGTSGSAGAGGSNANACNVVEATQVTLPSPHVAECSYLPYAESNPPSSGPHYGIWAAFKTYTSAVPRGYLVHDLEHGAIVITYNCPAGCADEIAKAQAVIDAFVDPLCANAASGSKKRVTMAPDPKLDTTWAVAAWGHTLRATCVDAPAFSTFMNAYFDKATESFCNEGIDVVAQGLKPKCGEIDFAPTP